MDIVARLNSFINQLGMPVTQVADSCGIRRPSMTQLLKGRNQKISDDVLRKLHARFPQLNILWLLCGEGDMLLGENNEISEPEMSAEMSESLSEPSVAQMSQHTIDFGTDASGVSAVMADLGGTVEIGGDASADSGVKADEKTASTASDGYKKTISFAPDSSGEKKIVNIIIYYSDNSFEAFVPKDRG